MNCEGCLRYLGNTSAILDALLRSISASGGPKIAVDDDIGIVFSLEGPRLPSGFLCSCGVLFCSEACKASEMAIGHGRLCSKDKQRLFKMIRGSEQHDPLALSVIAKLYAAAVDLSEREKSSAESSGKDPIDWALDKLVGHICKERFSAQIFRQANSEDNEENRADFRASDL